MAYGRSSVEENAVGNFLSFLIGFFIIFIFSLSFFGVEKYLCRKYATSEFIKHNAVETAIDNIDSDKEGKLVRLSGKTATDEVISDNTFNISVDNCLSLNRVVEMYQWGETRHTHRERRGKNSYRTYYTYTYDKGWYKHVVNSSAFHYNNTYKNPKTMGYENSNMVAKNITLGAHKIPSASIRNLSASVFVEIDSQKVKMPISAIVYNNYIYYNVIMEELAKKDKEKADFHITDERGRPFIFEVEKYQVNPKDPKIGDVRIHFSKHPTCETTILAKQAKNSFVPFAAEFSDIFIVRYGNVSVDDLVSEGEKQGKGFWIARIFLFLAISFGSFIMFYKMQLLGCLFALSNALIISSGMISFVWRPYMPFVGYVALGLMLLGCFCSFLIWVSRERAY